MSRRIGALMVAAPLVAGVLLPGVPAEASAAVGAKIYVENGFVATHSFTIRAKTAAGGGSLLIDGASHGYGKNKTLSYVFDGHSQSNGTHTIKVDGTNSLLWWDSATVTFKSAVPASPPSGLSTSVSGSKVTVTWNQGEEPDITGYRLSSSVKSFTVGPGACGGSQCSKTFNAGSASGTLAISVAALRHGAAASAARQTSAKLTGSGTSTSPNNNNSAPIPNGGGGGNQAPLPIPSGFNTPAPKSPQVFPQVTSKPFAYPTPTPETADDTNLVTAGSQGPAETDDALQWGKSVAIALILLLAAAHLGTWTRRLRAANATHGHGGLVVTPGSAHARVQSSREQIEAALLAARTKSDAEAATRTKPSKERKRRSRKKPTTKPATSVKADLVHPARPTPAEEPVVDLAQQPEPALDLLAKPEPQPEPMNNVMAAAKAGTPQDLLPEVSSSRTEILELPKPRRGRRHRARK